MSSPNKAAASVFQFAASLGRPVARGLLSDAEAVAAILCHCLRLGREGRLTDPVDAARVAEHVMRLHADNQAADREKVAGAIRRTLRPLLAIGAPSSCIRESAHGENHGRGLPLFEYEADQIALVEAWRHLQPAHGGESDG